MHSFCDEEKAELLPKNITRTAKMQLENYEHTSARVNILTLYPDLPRNRETSKGPPFLFPFMHRSLILGPDHALTSSRAFH